MGNSPQYTLETTLDYTQEQLDQLNRLYESRLETKADWTPEELYQLNVDVLRDYEKGIRASQ